MARIDINLDSRSTPRIHDRADDQSDRRFVWVEIRDLDGSYVALKAGFGLVTDDQAIEAIEPLLSALERMRDAARDRIKDREWIAAAQAARDTDTPVTPDEGDHYVRETVPA